MERSLYAKKQFMEFATMMEYFTLGHAHRRIAETSMASACCVQRIKHHATKTCVVSDASAKSTSGVSLNDIMMVGPNIHPLLIDILLCFRLHRVAM